jgi:NTP pyrophosphatase (non-canonical NTP hydrolase)
MSELQDLTELCRDFAARRDWFQFHTPKNLAMAIAGEAGELAAEFQWMTPEQSQVTQLSSNALDAVRMEIADVAIYLLRLCDELQVDLATAVREKIAINEVRFPA